MDIVGIAGPVCGGGHCHPLDLRGDADCLRFSRGIICVLRDPWHGRQAQCTGTGILVEPGLQRGGYCADGNEIQRLIFLFLFWMCRHVRTGYRQQKLFLLVAAALAADARTGHSVQGTPDALRARIELGGVSRFLAHRPGSLPARRQGCDLGFAPDSKAELAPLLALPGMQSWYQDGLRETWRGPDHEDEAVRAGTWLQDLRVPAA